MARPLTVTGDMQAIGNPSHHIDRAFGEVEVNVKALGAVGDGVTDDTAAIDRAYDHCAVGGRLVFPPGTYLFTGLVIAKSITIRGAGSIHKWNVGTSATTLLYNGVGNAITVNNTAGLLGGIRFEDFELRDKTPGTGDNGIYLHHNGGTGIQNVEFVDIQVTDFGGSGIASLGTVFDVHFFRVGTENCGDDSIKMEADGGQPGQWRFYDCWLSSSNGTYAANVGNCYFFGGTIAGRGTGHGLQVSGQAYIYGLHIEGVEAENSIGLHYSSGNECIADGCHLHLWDHAIKIGEGAAVARGFYYRGHCAGAGDTDDVWLMSGGSRDGTIVEHIGAAAAVWSPVIQNDRVAVDAAYGEMWVCTSKTPFAMAERFAAPTSPITEGIYLDDGTNTVTGLPGFRRYTGAAWEDIGAGALPKRSTTAGITAVNPGVQGDGELVSEVNEVSTVANANDAVTMPGAAAGRRVVIINNGANTLEIWPAVGDNCGAGVNTAVTLAAGSNVEYVAYNNGNWEAL